MRVLPTFKSRTKIGAGATTTISRRTKSRSIETKKHPMHIIISYRQISYNSNIHPNALSVFFTELLAEICGIKKSTMARTIKDYALLFLKGMGMGAADVVPGVSGGTIAFITGVYDELLTAIKSIDGTSIKMLFSGKFRAFWQAIHGNFLLSLFGGIVLSVLSLARLITWLLSTYPILVWAFFFGLVLASVWFVSRDIKDWNTRTVISFILGLAAALFITSATPAETPTALWFIFLCGAIAICAMILPGISGSFILLLLGKYAFIMEAVKDWNFVILGVFLLGALIGITSFSRLLSYALRRWRAVTLALLTGFMTGSLNKVWPWKTADAAGIEHNIAPDGFLWQAVLLALAGFFLVWGIEKISERIHA